jgi:hypothetical protein
MTKPQPATHKMHDHGAFGVLAFQMPSDGRAYYMPKTEFKMVTRWTWAEKISTPSSHYDLFSPRPNFATEAEAIKDAEVTLGVKAREWPTVGELP